MPNHLKIRLNYDVAINYKFRDEIIFLKLAECKNMAIGK